MAAYTTIDDPSAYFQTALYEGTTSTRKTVTNDGNSDLQPGLFWFKNRDSSTSHVIADTNRGANNSDGGYTIVSNTDSTAVEVAEAKGVMTITSNGFTVEEMTSAAGNVNTNSMVCWQWAGSGQGTGVGTDVAESGNNPGFKRQTNATAGLSIILYVGTGAAGTIAHGLNSAPKFMMIKSGSTTDPWAVYYGDATDYLVLNTTAATVDSAAWWNDTAPTSSVFTVGTDHSVNEDAKSYIAYVWAEVQGYSKFGTYIGNGNADGTFVYTGFKPAWVMIKPVTAVEQWVIIDGTRSPSNQAMKQIKADDAAAEYNGASVTNGIDILSNGFKVRTSRTEINTNGVIYTYMAFASSPFVSSTGTPTTAR